MGVTTPTRNRHFFVGLAPLPRKIARMPEGVKSLKSLKSLNAPFGSPPLDPPSLEP